MNEEYVNRCVRMEWLGAVSYEMPGKDERKE